MSSPGPNLERFQTVVTILIAIMSTAVALVASQVAVTIGSVTEAQHNGVLAKINLERVDSANYVELMRNLRAFNEYRFSGRLRTLTQEYVQPAMDAGQTVYETRLRQEAAAFREDQDIAGDFVHFGYVLTDENGEYTGFDRVEFLADERRGAEIDKHLDLDSADNFADEARFRTQALAMNISMIVLFVSVMFLTWAQITRSALRWVWLAAGVLVALGVLAAYALSGMAGMLGL
jgi:hypothetical protein